MTEFTSFAAFFIANPDVLPRISQVLGRRIYSDDNAIVDDTTSRTIAAVQLYDDADGEYLFVTPLEDKGPSDFLVRPLNGMAFNPEG